MTTVSAGAARAHADLGRRPDVPVSEPAPAPRGPGRIILLNGASSSGKSSLARALQAAMPEPFLHVSSDQLVGMLPQRTGDGGPFDWWHQVRPRFFAGFHRCLPALAAAGNDLIVEHIIEFRSWRVELAALLAGLDVFLVACIATSRRSTAANASEETGASERAALTSSSTGSIPSARTTWTSTPRAASLHPSHERCSTPGTPGDLCVHSRSADRPARGVGLPGSAG